MGVAGVAARLVVLVVLLKAEFAGCEGFWAAEGSTRNLKEGKEPEVLKPVARIDPFPACGLGYGQSTCRAVDTSSEQARASTTFLETKQCVQFAAVGLPPVLHHAPASSWRQGNRFPASVRWTCRGD